MGGQTPPGNRRFCLQPTYDSLLLSDDSLACTDTPVASWRAFFITAAVNYINYQVPPNLRSTGQTLFSAVFWGLGATTGNALAGFMFDRLGPATMYRYQGIFALCVALYALLVLPTAKTQDAGTPD